MSRLKIFILLFFIANACLSPLDAMHRTKTKRPKTSYSFRPCTLEPIMPLRSLNRTRNLPGISEPRKREIRSNLIRLETKKHIFDALVLKCTQPSYHIPKAFTREYISELSRFNFLDSRGEILNDVRILISQEITIKGSVIALLCNRKR